MSKSPAKGGIRTDHIKAKELPQAAQEGAEGAAHDAAERGAREPGGAAPGQPPGAAACVVDASADARQGHKNLPAPACVGGEVAHGGSDTESREGRARHGA